MDPRSFMDRIWKPDADRMAGPVNLDAIGYAENRNLPGWTRPFPGPDGELGKFQITPPMWNDLKRKMPEKYGSKNRWFTSVIDPFAEEAVVDYFKVLDGYAKHYNIPATERNMAQAYNVGIGNLRKGRTNSDYDRQYQDGLRATKQKPQAEK